MRFNFTIEKKVLERRGKLLFPRTLIKDVKVYAESYEEALEELKKKGYKVVSDETSL